MCVANSPCEILCVGPLVLRHRDVPMSQIKFFRVYFMKYEKNQRCPDEARDSFGRLEKLLIGLYILIPLMEILERCI